jgi:5-(carboxyamino)imidazole ribonucleotide synthase
MTEALPPGATIGILGGGQLGRMLAVAAAELGLKCHIFCPDPDSPAFDVSAAQTIAAYDDRDALEAFVRSVDAVTYEFENVDLGAAEQIAALKPLRPGAKALEVSQDRLNEKQFLAGKDIPVGGFLTVDPFEPSARTLEFLFERLGETIVMKTRRFGYDGKGQAILKRDGGGLETLAGFAGQDVIFEAFVPFAREVSIMAVRGSDGEIAAYDVTENVHADHILATSTVPAGIQPETEQEARRIAARILHGLDYVGVLGIEFFVVGESGGEKLLVNEIAPRVHNSGHWTQDGCAVSQFENHIRAVADWPLGPTDRHSDIVMTNLIGQDAAEWRALAADPQARLHLYGKSEIRPGRKMGHVNRVTRRT